MKMEKGMLKFLLFAFFITTSCSSNLPKTKEQKVQLYESKARTYQALAWSQRLSSPYSSPIHLQNRGGLYDPSMRMVYLSEAKKYRKLAEEAKAQSNYRQII